MQYDRGMRRGKNMIIKGIIVVLISAIGIYSVIVQYERKNKKGIIWSIVGTIALGIMSSLIYDNIKPFLPYLSYSDSSISTSNSDIGNYNEIEEMDVVEKGEAFITSKSDPVQDTQEMIVPEYYIEDITGQTSVSGKISQEGQKNSYKFTSKIEGTYRFYADLSAGGEVRVRISGENGNSLIDRTNGVTIYLEAGETYILDIEYQKAVCDYVINIGVPVEVTDITGKTSASGSITYQDQKDRYRYMASVSGTYRFDTNLSAGGEVRVRISGENGKSLIDRTNGVTINLEAGETYILSIEYQKAVCDYVINIGIPVEVTDITGKTSASGSITYQDQKDRYRYTAPVSGTYHFDTNLSAGGEVRVRISGENGKSLIDRTNGLTVNLEAGETYILAIEYQKVVCDYSINIGVPVEVTDITGKTSISGSITYQDQKDRYRYTAPVSGTYCFDTNLSAGGEVRVRISGENGKSLIDRTNGVTVNLEAGETYILSIEHRKEHCFYEVFIETP